MKPSSVIKKEKKDQPEEAKLEEVKSESKYGDDEVDDDVEIPDENGETKLEIETGEEDAAPEEEVVTTTRKIT